MENISLEEAFDNFTKGVSMYEGYWKEVWKTLNEWCIENLSNLGVTKIGKLASGVEYKAYFRHGEVRDAKNHLIPLMIEKLDQVTEEKLQGYGLKF
ncbi:hypothetical protein Goshw_021368 [Gossypium schwendimanii]|uniref:Sulfotransferase n=1 Tax=Gossypium schwendimanii TaxID=34291 RepID=A0A7J9MUD7_GOSSC|nr:hypothetical protein [Gossypium schwendimanii]